MNGSTIKAFIAVIAIAMGFSSCSTSGSSSTTGWKYNDPDWGGFEKLNYQGQETGPGLVFVEGGTFVMGQTEQDVTFRYDAMPRRVTVRSFYMDQTEVANIHYREYLYWVKRTFGADYPEVYRRALPDTLVWRDELSYNDPYVDYYFRHPAYDDYPVVGVTWLQANEYCKWRTDRVNEFVLIERGILNVNAQQVNEDNFNTDAYLIGQYEGSVNKNLPDLDPNGSGERPVRFEDGILLPGYRLPTEAEWEYAAVGLIGNQPYGDEERFTDRRIYPWDGTSMRYPKGGGWQGKMLANFKRGRGDFMGLAGNLNDNADITAPVDAFFPNDFGLYNMAGNVNEWVADAYRSLSLQDMNDLNPYRGNVFDQMKLDDDGIPVEKDSLGRVVMEPVQDNDNRRNYKKSDNINYNDGDRESMDPTQTEDDDQMYQYGVSTLVSDKTRVYKGGSWNDRAYFLAPGARRYLEEDQASSTVGFRCAMDRVGSPGGNMTKGGNNFRSR